MPPPRASTQKRGPTDWIAIVKHVTLARAAADAEAARQEAAWRHVIQDAMVNGASGTRLAEVARVSRERVYQIKDGRR